MRSCKFSAIVLALELLLLQVIADAIPALPEQETSSKGAEDVSHDRLLRQVADKPQQSLRAEVAVDADGSFVNVAAHQVHPRIGASAANSHSLGISAGQRKAERHRRHDKETHGSLTPNEEAFRSKSNTVRSSMQASDIALTSKSIVTTTNHALADFKAPAEAPAQAGQLEGNLITGAAAADDESVQLYTKYLFYTACLAFVAVSMFTVHGQHDIPDAIVGWIACTLYLVLALSNDLIISKAKSNGVAIFNFEPACVVILVEFGKFVASAGLFGLSRIRPMLDGESLLSEQFSVNDVAWLSLPAVLFLLSNILAFKAIGANDMASFGVFRDTVLLWNAAIWCVVFQVALSWKRILALLGIFFGLCINQITPLLSASWSPAILLVCIMALLNACASVAQEYALKQNMALNINVQNSISCVFGMLAGTLYLGVMSPAKLSSAQAFFEGFDTLTFMLVCLLLTLSLLVVRILKYANSVMKSIVQSLRGPLIVLIAPSLGLQSRTDTLAYVSAIIVALSACYFLLQGKPNMREKSMSTSLDDKATTK